MITAGSGDEGYLNWVPGSPEGGEISYPASSPQVVSVGGTRLEDVGGTWTSTVWNGDGIGREKGASGGGCSEHYEAPYWQLELPHWPAVGCSRKRAVADISAVADPYTGIAVYDTTPNEQGQTGWERLGGTSVASPLIAAMFALAGGSHGVESPARTLYENEALTHGALTDVVSGSNGFCRPPPTAEGLTRCSLAELAKSCAGQAICLAGPGYDGPSGLGTPDGIGAFEATGAAAKKPQQVKFISQAPSGARFDGPDYAVAAKSSSGLQVSVVSLTPSVCELNGSDVSFSGVGTCAIEAFRAGDDEYQAAAPVQQSFGVERAPQTITFTSTPPQAPTAGGSPYTVSAIASSGLAVVLSSVTGSVCTVEGATVSFVAAGTCTVDASQAGNADWEPASDVQQSIAVGAEQGPPVLQPVMPGPTGGALSFSSSGPSPKPDSDFTISRLGEGHRTGAITFSLLLSDPGSVSWRLTFAPRGSASLRALRGGCAKGRIRLAGRCHASPGEFATGRLQSARAGTVGFTARPAQVARWALAATAGSTRGILVTVELTMQSAKGGAPTSQTRSLADYLDAVHKR